jgi:carbonic anhydrase
MTSPLQDLIDNNRRWAERVERERPGFFSKLAQQQNPKYLWIGCSDSRVPANQITGLEPGEVFVHRNVANVVVHSDLNALSVIQFATDMLKVKHIIVVGHSGCGGVAAALHDRRVGLADNWISHVKDVRNKHQAWLDTVHESRRIDALCELNVIEQARNVCHTTVVEEAWRRGQELVIHGWFYGLYNGLLQDMKVTIAGPEQVGTAYDDALAGLQSRYASMGAVG